MPLDLSDERVFADEHPVRHLFIEGEADARRLIVVFSGFHLVNQTKTKYNYVRALTGTSAHRVHVLDDLGVRGCYYLGADKDLFVARSVGRMIETLTGELGLDRSDVVLTGSSKGGSAALHIGARFGYRVLAAAPQTKIATYLTQEIPAKGVAKLIAGSLSPEDMHWLDEVVNETFRDSPHRPPIEIFTSDGDAQAHVHVNPFVELARDLDYPVEVIKGSYTGHREVAAAFPRVLHERFVARAQGVSARPEPAPAGQRSQPG